MFHLLCYGSNVSATFLLSCVLKWGHTKFSQRKKVFLVSRDTRLARLSKFQPVENPKKCSPLVVMRNDGGNEM